LILEDNEHGIRAARASGAHLLEIDTPADVTYANIRAAIDAVQKGT
jgi:beta-phosphoglucomutase